MPRTIADVMTVAPMTVPPDATLVDAARVMREGDVGAVIVLDDAEVRGLVTDRDLVIRGIAEGRDPSSTQVSEVSSRDLTTVESSGLVEEAVRLMRERNLRRLPVVEEGKPVGIVSLGDLAVEREPDSALADISAAAPNR
jgi:CBS domain-containing protein